MAFIQKQKLIPLRKLPAGMFKSQPKPEERVLVLAPPQPGPGSPAGRSLSCYVLGAQGEVTALSAEGQKPASSGLVGRETAGSGRFCTLYLSSRREWERILGHWGPQVSCRDGGAGETQLPNSSGSSSRGEQGAASFDSGYLHGKLRLEAPEPTGPVDTLLSTLEPLCSFCLLASSTSGVSTGLSAQLGWGTPLSC